MSRSLKLGGSAVSDPIRGYNRRGFVIGWCAITLTAVLSFGLLTQPLDFTSMDPDAVLVLDPPVSGR
ncbi:hypothetical protein [Pelagibacterium limicola]|uniref:hypothetical protein n=1 Tax=Pelagibacterium limicola TaxID=2791022 RepID=UPI0018AFCBD5|nr:hypothetical protein [Pelagibacterium limicola]